MPSHRERLKTTFESVAHQYHQARPDYPEALFDELVDLTGVRPGDQLLEVGCGTGKATLPLARRGYEITCIELGSDLAAEARTNLAAYPHVTVIQHAFEAWEPAPPAGQFDLLFVATAWHWVDPAVGYKKAWNLLRPGGQLAVWAAEHVIPVGGDPFFDEIQDVYDEIGEGLPPGTPLPTPDQMSDHRAGIEGSGLFTDYVTRSFDWEVKYTAQEYIALLDTFSSHIAMDRERRDRLYGEIRRRLALRPDGRLRRHWGALLQVARRKDG
jgi:SAM-dependent methyltransferase